MTSFTFGQYVIIAFFILIPIYTGIYILIRAVKNQYEYEVLISESMHDEKEKQEILAKQITIIK